MFNRSRRNLAHWFTLSMGSILLVFTALLYLREARDRLRFFDQALYNTCRVMASGVQETGHQNQEEIDLENVPLLGSDAILLNTNLVFARWYTPEKQLMQFVGSIPPLQLTGEIGFETIRGEQFNLPGTQLRQLTLPVYQEGRLLGYLQVAESLAPVEAPLRQLQLFLVVGVPCTLAAITLAGWLLGGAAMQPIRQSYQQLQQFTADASHELRAPLAGIVSNAQVGLMEPIDPQEQTTRLKTISAVAESMGFLVNHLLFLARHEGALPVEALQSVNLASLLQPVIAEYDQQAKSKGLKFVAHLPDRPLMLKAEPDLLRQAVVNLLSNACRYTPLDGTVELYVASQLRWAVIRVKDTGIGITEADLPRIFDRFYRADKVRSRQTGGFGLGLAIARQIIEVHGGHITVTSQVEQGSTFEIRLPLTTHLH
ncbi:HAMP domain-containing histidine kinase [Phormidium tenue FACHB-886]|nr:HAMP domain-containing histidine kinase [Phormidium tenue FACHB-886]